MKSLERRYQTIVNLEPQFSSYTCFSRTVSGCEFKRPTIAKWFNKLVDKNDYEKKDRLKLIEHLLWVTEFGDYYDTRFWSNKFRNMPEYQEWRLAVLDKEGGQCVRCGSSKKIEVDHIKQFKDILLENNIRETEEARECAELWDVENGRCLCASCHMVRHSAKNDL